MLTYKQEDLPSPSEDKIVLEEGARAAPLSDEAPVSTAEVAVTPPPPSILDTDDLLVSF